MYCGGVANIQRSLRNFTGENSVSFLDAIPEVSMSSALVFRMDFDLIEASRVMALRSH